MTDLTMPTINVTFKEAAKNVKQAGNRGVLAMIVKEAEQEAPQTYVFNKAEEIPAGLSAENKADVERAFLGNDTAPKKVILYVGTDLAAGLTEMKKYKFSWLVGPQDLDQAGAQSIAEWIKDKWSEGESPRAVTANNAADHPGIVNLMEDAYTTADGTELSAAKYCSRIAGLICGTEVSKSITFAVLDDLTSVSAKSRTEIDAAIKAGKLCAFNDGEKIKIARGVTSLTTEQGAFTEAYKKIRLTDIICTVKEDITKLIADRYIGKFANTYENKCALIAAIRDYLSELAVDGVIEDTSSSQIDVDAQRAWLVLTGKTEAASWNENQVRQANTGSKVFIKLMISLLDAVEDVEIIAEY